MKTPTMEDRYLPRPNSLKNKAWSFPFRSTVPSENEGFLHQLTNYLGTSFAGQPTAVVLPLMANNNAMLLGCFMIGLFAFVITGTI